MSCIVEVLFRSVVEFRLFGVMITLSFTLACSDAIDWL